MKTIRRSAFFAFVLSGVLLGVLAGCGASNPNLGKAEDAMKNNQYERALANIDTAIAQDSTVRGKAYNMRADALRELADSTMPYEKYKDLYRQARIAEDSAMSYDQGLRSEVRTKRTFTYTQQYQQGAKLFQRAQRTADSSTFERAATHFGAASATAPDSARAMFNESIALLNMERMKQNGKMTNVIPVLERYFETVDQPQKDAYDILGSLYQRNNQMEEAIDLLERAREDLSGRPAYFQLRGSPKLGYTATIEEGGSSRKVEGSLPDRISLKSEGPVSATFQKNRKKGQLQVELYYKGSVIRDTISRSGAGSVSLSADLSEETPLAELEGRLLNAYNRAGMTKKAMQEYREQIDKNPENVTYRYNYGSMLLNARRYDQAIEQLKKAIELEPNNEKAQYNLGAAYTNKGKEVQDSIRAIEDSLASIRDAAMEENREPTEQEKQTVNELDQKSKQLAQKMKDIFKNAIPPLERARQLADTGNSLRKDACVALVTAYIQTEQIGKAKQVEDCAGMQLKQGGN